MQEHGHCLSRRILREQERRNVSKRQHSKRNQQESQPGRLVLHAETDKNANGGQHSDLKFEQVK